MENRQTVDDIPALRCAERCRSLPAPIYCASRAYIASLVAEQLIHFGCEDAHHNGFEYLRNHAGDQHATLGFMARRVSVVGVSVCMLEMCADAMTEGFEAVEVHVAICNGL